MIIIFSMELLTKINKDFVFLNDSRMDGKPVNIKRLELSPFTYLYVISDEFIRERKKKKKKIPSCRTYQIRRRKIWLNKQKIQL